MFKQINYVKSKLDNIENYFLKKLMLFRIKKNKNNPKSQKTEIYEDENFITQWGEGTAWHELKYLFANLEGKVLDIACGAGQCIKFLNYYKKIEVYGCDFSETLINVAIKNGISKNKLLVCDATDLKYSNNEFEYSYSVGSLEHFTIDQIDLFISESKRVTKKTTFHHIPISKDKNFGWIELSQAYYLNSEKWWLEKFGKHYQKIFTLESSWKDPLSKGLWIICEK